MYSNLKKMRGRKLTLPKALQRGQILQMPQSVLIKDPHLKVTVNRSTFQLTSSHLAKLSKLLSAQKESPPFSVKQYPLKEASSDKNSSARFFEKAKEEICKFKALM